MRTDKEPKASTKMKEKKYRVSLQLNCFDFYVKAVSQAEAKKKAVDKIRRMSQSKLVDKNNTFVEKIDYL